MASGATITDVALENNQHAKYKLLQADRTPEEAAKESKKLNSKKTDAADPLVGTHVDILVHLPVNLRRTCVCPSVKIMSLLLMVITDLK